MTTKERWTVYPLLLLAIGLAVRGGSNSPEPPPTGPVASVAADTVVCTELQIIGEGGAIVIHAGSIEFFDAKGTLVGRLGPRPVDAPPATAE